MIVDAHHHVWQIRRGDYDWLEPNSPIHRDYAVSDLRPLLGEINATVLVQAAATKADTVFILDAAHKSEGLVRGVVGWTDLAEPDAADRLARMVADKLLRGLRPMLQDIDSTRWILRPDVRRGLDAMTRVGLRLDLLIQPRHLGLLPELADRHPNLPLVIDHAAKPMIAQDQFAPWAQAIRRAATQTPAFCKLSGLPNEASEDWTIETLRPYVNHLLEWFGPHRLMWGSDWPVVNLAGGFARWREASLALLPESAHAAILGETAVRFYGLQPLLGTEPEPAA